MVAAVKLPDIQYRTGVRSLGRYDATSVQQPAGAQARTAYEWARAMDLVADAADSAYRANAAAEYAKAKADLERQEQELRSLLNASPTIDTEQFPLPDWLGEPKEDTVVDSNGETSKTRSRYVPTHTVALDLYDGMLQRHTDAVLENITNPLARAKLREVVPAIATRNRASIIAQQVKFFRETQRGTALAAIDNHIASDDELGARIALAQAVETGIVTGEEVADLSEKIGQRIDGGRYNRMTMMARHPGELEVVESYVAEGVLPDIDPETGETVLRQSRLTPEQQRTAWGEVEQARDRLEERRSERHKENARVLSSALIEGRLSSGAIVQALEADDIDHRFALTLANTLRTRANETPNQFRSNPAALDYYRRRIRTVRHQNSPGRMSDRVSALEDQMRNALSGVTEEGREYHGPRLNGTDYQTLLNELRNEVDQVAQRPDYDQAVRRIYGVTGYTEGIDILGAGNADRVKAKSDAMLLLDDYMDRMGAQARPLEFVSQIEPQITATQYAGASLENFVARYPQFDRFIRGFDMVTDERARWEARQNIKGQIFIDYQRGAIDEETARVMYLQIGGDWPDTLEEAALREDEASAFER